MKKVEISKAAVMTRAWEIRKSNTVNVITMSVALKQAWKEAKENMMEENKKEEVFSARVALKQIAEVSAIEGYNKYNPYEKAWENYGKSRTYLCAYEYRLRSKGWKYYQKIDCGYIDNTTGEYHAGKVDLRKPYNFHGRKIA